MFVNDAGPWLALEQLAHGRRVLIGYFALNDERKQLMDSREHYSTPEVLGLLMLTPPPPTFTNALLR